MKKEELAKLLTELIDEMGQEKLMSSLAMFMLGVVYEDNQNDSDFGAIVFHCNIGEIIFLPEYSEKDNLNE